jgi:hypothetical protein
MLTHEKKKAAALKLEALDRALESVCIPRRRTYLLGLFPPAEPVFLRAFEAVCDYLWVDAIEECRILQARAYQKAQRDYAEYLAKEIEHQWNDAGLSLGAGAGSIEAEVALRHGMLDIYLEITR